MQKRDSIHQDELDRVKQREHSYSRDFKDKADIRNPDIRRLFFAFLNRARFKYTLGDIFEYLLWCLCLRDIGEREERR